MEILNKKAENLFLFPNDLYIEQVVLGASLQGGQSIHKLLEWIPLAEVFYQSRHRALYESMKDLASKNKTIDIITVTHNLRAAHKLEEVGGAYYITELTSMVSSSANLEHHAMILTQLWMRRVLIDLSDKIRTGAINISEDILDLMFKCQADLLKVTNRMSQKTERTAKELVNEAIDEIVRASKSVSGITGVRFGFYKIDRHFGGLQNSDLIIIAGRPGMGKTTFALNGFVNACTLFGHKGVFFSLEMSNKQIIKKILASKSGLTTNQIVKGNMTVEEMSALDMAADTISTDNMIIDDSSSLTFELIRSKLHLLKATKRIDFAVIDYLQLVRSQEKFSSREREVSAITRGLKLVAKDLNIPIIALCQLNRNSEGRADKRPTMSELRESGSIEQDADVVMLLYRPEYYKIETMEDGSSSAGKCELINDKHRNGATGTFQLGFFASNSTFYDLQ